MTKVEEDKAKMARDLNEVYEHIFTKFKRKTKDEIDKINEY